jgi:alanine racemase
MSAAPDSSVSMLRSWVEVSGAALRHNAALAGRLAGGGREGVMAVVKADAYGHGLQQVTGALCRDIGAFAVASVDEAVLVEDCARRYGEGRLAPIYILSPALPEETAQIVRHGFIPAVSTVDEVRRYSASSREKTTAVNVVVDTGMGRMGALPPEATEVLRAVHSSPGLTLDCVSSHFPSSDEDEAYTTAQEIRFRTLASQWQAEFGPIRLHIANSAGILHYPRPAGELVRAGLMLYGVSPLAKYQDQLQPALTWKTRVTLVRRLPAGHGISYGRTFITPRPMLVASLAAGYGDGYPRQVSGQEGSVLILGRRCPILGRVTMDQIMADVSALPSPPEPGDEAVLLGSQGEASISAPEIATLAGMIPWQVFTGITRRTVRRMTEIS